MEKRIASQIKKDTIETFYPTSQKKWRQWLQKNHVKKQCIWVICYKKSSNKPTITWSEAVDEALCFGWIDSTRRPIDDEKFMQYFCKRKTTSVWSQINKEKVQRLIKDGLMTPAGMAIIETAKKNGSWSVLDDAAALKIPADLELKFKTRQKAKKYFLGLSKSDKKNILQWLALAKRDETRKKRIDEVVTLAGQHLKPKQFR